MFNKISTEFLRYNLLRLPQLVFEVTDACNLRCKYCGYAELYGGYDKRENLYFPFERAKILIDYLYGLWRENGIKETCSPITISFYGGEPLLNVPFIKRVIDYLEQLPPVGKRFYYGMTSNAMLLDKYMDFLAEKEVRLLISLDGDKEGQGYRVDAAGHNSFDRVFSNINLLREKYPTYFETNVRFNAVLHKKNNVEGIYRFIKDTFGKAPIISPLNNSGIRPDKREEFNRTYRNYRESLEQATNCEGLKRELFIDNPETSRLLDYLYYHSGNVFFSYNHLLAKDDEVSHFATGTCTPFSKKMFVTVKGRILQCERINHEFALGQVTDSGVELDLEQAARQHNDYVEKYIRQCAHCGNRTACMQCVYQIDDIHEVNTYCRSFCSEAQRKERNRQSLAYLSRHPELYKRLLNEVVIRG